MTRPASSSRVTTADELDRLSALYGSGLLDVGADDAAAAALDSLVALAASLLDCRGASLTLIDRDVQHVHASAGQAMPGVPRAIALCDHAIRQPDQLVVPDLAADPRFATSPLIAHGIRFYAGAPIHAPGGNRTPRPIGALCVTDSAPRDLDERGQAMLRHLARFADLLIAARGDAQRAVGIARDHQQLVTDLARQHRVFAQAERLTGIGSWRLTLADERVEWSEGVFRIYGLPPGTRPTIQIALDPYPPEAQGRVAAALAHAIEHCASFDFEEDFRPAAGELRRVRCLGECEQVDGEKVALVGVFQDITDRHRMETALRRDADTDALTGLANRAAFDKRLAAAMEAARAAPGEAAALFLVLIDLDGFKAVNDTLGHAAGDDVLRTIGATLRALPFATALTARIGGDEFALLVDEAAADPAAIAATLETILMVEAGAGGLTLSCGGSVGIAALGEETSPRDFFHRADLALYAAKRARIGDRRAAERRRAA